VTLSGELDSSSSSVDGGGAIYMQPLGPQGPLGFASSQSRGLVIAHEKRDVTVIVPETATRLIIGVALVGGGKVNVERLRLTTADAPHVSASELVDVAIRTVRANALFADRIDWPTVEPRMRNAAKGMHASTEAYPLIVDLLASLQDRHSKLLSVSDQNDQLQHGRVQGKSSVRALDDGIGYVSVPGFVGSDAADGAAFASSLAAGIERVAASGSKGWVVDLREDTGGNMQPMLSGLRPLLGPGKLGSFRTRDGKTTPWFGVSEANAVESSVELSSDQVAVIIGPNTSSSGEIVAISFEGRPNTRFFGEPSDGRTTGNRSFPLPDGSGLLLACASELDRRDQRYDERVVPDVETPPSGPGDDIPLKAAEAWLKQSQSTRP
jgi:hypothetical protein